MICCEVRINPLGHRADVVLRFRHPPLAREIIEALAEMIQLGDHEQGASILSRCIEAVHQHGVPRLEPGKNHARYKWQVPGAPERFGHIIVEPFVLFGAEDREGDTGRRDEASAFALTEPIAATLAATAPLVHATETSFAWRDACRQRCAAIVDNIASGNPQSKKLAAGMLATLFSEITCPQAK